MQHRAGIVSYLEVVDANREVLQAERANAQLAGQRQIAAVQLIKALGGGWTEQEILPAQRTFKNHQSSDEGCEAHYDLSDTASPGVPLPDV